MRNTERGEHARDAASLFGGRGGEPLAQRGAARVDAHLPARLGVDEPQLSDVGQLLLARVADLDGEDVVARRAAAGAASASRAARGSRRRRRRCRAAARSRRRGRARRRARSRRPCRRSGSRPSAVSRPSRPWRPCVGGSVAGASSPNVITPRRFPRRVAMCPTAIATPAATSALRRSAVPNCIDGDVSSTSHVTSTRSASCTRTCGSPVRAVTFHSMSRTSSPGAYGRTCASSVPGPWRAER